MDDRSFGMTDAANVFPCPSIYLGSNDEWINRVIISYGPCNGCATALEDYNTASFVRRAILMSNSGHSWSCGFDEVTYSIPSKVDLSPSVGMGIDSWLSGFYGRGGGIIDALGLQWEWVKVYSLCFDDVGGPGWVVFFIFVFLCFLTG